MPLPTDPLLASQWHLNNVTPGLFDLNVLGVWNPAEGAAYTGAGTLTVVIDDGFDYNHPDFDNYDQGLDYDFDTSTLYAFGGPGDAHGTAVAGIIGAAADGSGAVGVAFGTSLIGYRTHGFISDFWLQNIRDAIAAAANNAGGDVVNISQGIANDSASEFWNGYDLLRLSEIRTSIDTAVDSGRGGLGTTIVKAAGNSRADNYDVNADGWTNDTRQVVVAAVDQDGFVSSYSSFGAAVLVSGFGGPGDVVTTDRVGGDGYDADDFTETFNGTSAAAPMVAGVVALMYEANSGLGWRDVQTILGVSARQVGSEVGAGIAGSEQFAWTFNAAGTWNGGGQHFSNDYGYGLVDALAAVRLAETWLLAGEAAAVSANEFTNTMDVLNASTLIPGGDPAGLTFTGTAGFDDYVERVTVTMTFSTTWLADMQVYLISPDGTESLLIANQADSADFDGTWTFESQAFRGEYAGGTWSVRVVDAVSADPLTVTDIVITTFGSNSVNDRYIYTNEYSDYAGLFGHVVDVVDGNGGTDTVNASAVSSGSTIRLDGIAGVIDGISTTFADIENAIGGDGGDTITGNGSDNLLFGMRGADTINGGGGADTLDGGDGNDTFVYLASADLAAGESIDGGAGTGDEIVVRTNFENYGFNSATITGVEKLRFEGLHSVDLAGTQIGAGAITGVTGDGEFNQLIVSGAAINLSGVTFTGWTEGTDGISINGTGGADSLTGSGQADSIYGDNGADVLNGAAGDDAFFYFAAADLAAGEVINGGAGAGDAIQLFDSVSYNLALAAISGVEQLRFDGTGVTASLLGNQIGAGLIASVFGDTGVNTLNVSGAAVNLSGVTFTGWTDGTDVININGTAGADNLIGSGQRDNVIDNDLGDDNFNGGAGVDTLVSDLGHSDDATFSFLTGLATFSGGTFLHFSNFENITLGGGANVTGDNNANVITITETGATHTNNLNGGGGADTIIAGSGSDVISGGSGIDTINGGSGDDQIFIDDNFDVIIEAAAGGNDRILSSATYFLQAGVEIETMTTQNTAGVLALSLFGNEFNQLIGGNNGNNNLDGGAGADTLRGFGGSDNYYVDNALDTVIEAAGGGSDRVFASASYTLGAGQEIEIFTTTNTAGAGALNLTGNGFGQIIHGNAGANTLNGGGGNDTMSGFGGSDDYYADAAGDIVTEAVGGGTDRVFASVSFALGAGQEIEVLTTTNSAGAGALNLTGNAFGQTIQGNAGANTLNGGGGTDSMSGFGGGDDYYADAAGDIVTEAAGGGTDRVFASASFALGAGQEIEVLTTTNSAGAGALNLTGNAFGQTIQGNAGANTLNGGAGNDFISGFGGADIFVFNTALNAATNHDAILDFSIADDTIHLGNAIFTLAGAGGALAAALFKDLSLGAQDADDVIMYDRVNGDLYYDANGLTAGSTLFADVTNNLALTALDFFVI